MAVKFPCEIIGWTVLPSMRRELTIYLVKEKNFSRKKVCKVLDLTPSALSQYLSGKIKIPHPLQRRKWKHFIKVHGAHEHNLKFIDESNLKTRKISSCHGLQI